VSEEKKERESGRVACAFNVRHSGMTRALLLSCFLFPSSIKPRFLSLSFSIAVSCSPFLSLARSLYRSLALFRSLSVSTPPLSLSARSFACGSKQIVAYTSRSHRVVHTCVCVCVCMCTYVRVCVYMHIYVCVSVFMYTHTHTHKYICMYIA